MLKTLVMPSPFPFLPPSLPEELLPFAQLRMPDPARFLLVDPKGVDVKPCGVEIEAKFFVPRNEIERNLQLSTLPSCIISQAYFHREKIPALAELLARMTGKTEIAKVRYSRARLRWIEHKSGPKSGEEVTCIELKGRKNGTISRLEQIIHIPPALFQSLMAEADGGFLRKRRFHHSGWILGRNGKRNKADAHIDFLLSAPGRFLSRLHCDSSIFQRCALVDVEMPNPALYRNVLSPGASSFDYLQSGICLREASRRWQKFASSHTLAKRGLADPALVAAFNEMEERCQATA